MRKAYATIFVLYLLAACASAPQNPQQAVFAAKQSYAVALTVAVSYKRLPACATGGSPVCSDKAVVGRLQKADDAAAALLDGAEVTVRTGGGNVAMAITAAEQAVAAFTSITKTLRLK